MIIVKPIRQKLKFNGKLIGCTDTCLAMLGNGQALGGMELTEIIVRKVSGEAKPDPASPGLNQQQLVAAADALHFRYANRTGETWARVAASVAERRLVVAQLWYADIGGSNIGHAVLIVGKQKDGDYAIIDPMKGARYVKAAELRKAMTTFAEKTGLGNGGLRFGVSRIVPT